MTALRAQSRKDLAEAARCLGAFFRGEEHDESITQQARAAVGGQMVAQAVLDLRALVDGLSKG